MAAIVAAGATPVLCGCACCLRRATTHARHASPFPLPCSHSGNDFGGKCGTGSDSSSGAMGALCDAWRAKHGGKPGGKASFDSDGDMTVS